MGLSDHWCGTNSIQWSTHVAQSASANWIVSMIGVSFQAHQAPPHRRRRPTLLIGGRTLCADAARQVVDEVLVGADAVDIKRTASSEGVADTRLLRVGSVPAGARGDILVGQKRPLDAVTVINGEGGSRTAHVGKSLKFVL